jgi:hypothetical protein
MTAPVLAPVRFETPPVNPAPNGLYAATNWTETGREEALRYLNGVEIKGPNYGGENAFGVWGAPWCSVPPVDGDDRKDGERPEILDAFDPMTVWAFDSCDLTEPSRREVEARAAQILRLEEQPAVEREFANRLLLDAGTPQTVASLKAAVGYIEGVFARTNTVGFIHAGAQWASQEFGLVIKSGTRLTSPLGHTWVFGGGYVDGLENTLVATSQPHGWRDQPQVRTSLDERRNLYIAIAERTLLLGYEAVIAAATVAATP